MDSSMIALVKIPLFFICALLYHWSATPPSPTTESTEEEYESHEKSLPSVNRRIGRLEHPLFIWWTSNSLKGLYWGLGLAEVAMVLARQFPSSPLAAQILHLITGPNNPHIADVGTPSLIYLAGAALVMIGSIIRIACFRVMGRQFTFRLTILHNHKLITSGPYAVVRHPSYAGGMLQLLGAAMARFGPGSLWWEVMRHALVGKVLFANMLFSTGMAVYYFTRGEKEDEYLRKAFGSEWDEWARRVPDRYLPGIW
ncbi:hypothetical protein EWM64_g8509 [Hericium alpestre]|uniref:Protein-S-isoprenylcysteine O-methyltransferase n=1 Tax=Hericium alpestre TaxID=135208 RepID=A0A4Y9ZLK8_9AGAM|nr:hypothetical protein EWM64_g8509 [Hericium alpestre]